MVLDEISFYTTTCICDICVVLKIPVLYTIGVARIFLAVVFLPKILMTFLVIILSHLLQLLD